MKMVLKAASCFGLGRVAIFKKIVFPASLPSIFTGLRLKVQDTLYLCLLRQK
jgi:NitT/TauT family transport system permease protein